MLVSEILSGGDERRILCPIVLTNNTPHAERIEFRGTGCSCYGAVLDGRKLQPGEVLELAAGGSLKVTIDSQAPRNETTKEFEAYFLRSTADGPRAVQGTCSLSVYRDVRFDPEFLHLQLKSGSENFERDVLVHRCFRSETAASAEPQLRSLPAEATVVSIEEHGKPELLEEGLWRRTWKVRLRIAPSPATELDAPPRSIQAWFPQDGAVHSSGGTFQLVLRRDVPVHYPRTVHFGRMRVGQTRSQKLLVTCEGERAFELDADAAEMADAQLSSEILEGSGGGKRWVTLTLTPRAPGRLEEKVAFKTNLPEFPRFTIELTALVEQE